ERDRARVRDAGERRAADPVQARAASGARGERAHALDRASRRGGARADDAGPDARDAVGAAAEDDRAPASGAPAHDSSGSAHRTNATGPRWGADTSAFPFGRARAGGRDALGQHTGGGGGPPRAPPRPGAPARPRP